MHFLATMHVSKKRGTHLVKDESDSKSTMPPLRKKLNNALPIKPNLQHVKWQNVIPTASYTTTKIGDDGVAYIESDLQWL